LKLSRASLIERARRITAWRRQRSLSFESSLEDDPPKRSQIFGADQMEQHGRYLAGSHVIATGRAADRLLARLAANEKVLQRVFGQLTEAVMAERRVTPASEWLLDNFYLIEGQLRAARRHLPKSYSRELPSLAQGPSAGFPRVYDIALETIAHGDGRVDLQGLSRFLAAYQSVTTLNLGELWAIPIMLQLALIEKLRRVALHIEAGRIDRDLADGWSRRMITTVDRDPKSLILAIADMARSNPPMTAPFVSEFVRSLQGQGPALVLALTWIEQRLAEDGLTTEQLVRTGNQIQAADQVTIGNSIGSLRFLASVDWRSFVEATSAVDKALREDPVDAYAQMDFGSRNLYRLVIERIARRSERSEQQVAQAALRLAGDAAAREEAGGEKRSLCGHVGYYLIDRGLPELERAVRFRRPAADVVRSAMGRAPLPAYLGTIAVTTAVITGYLSSIAQADGLTGWRLALIAVLAMLVISQAAVVLVNWIATLLVKPSAMPRMNFSSGIPETSKALVVIPTMLTGIGSVDDLVEALEVRFLANRDDNVRFGLLTDFPDAAEESMPEDETLLLHARMRIEALNANYGGDSFYLFHRPRRWNPGERVWMGFERKRGKLADINWLLRHAGHASASERFALLVGNLEMLSGTRYVITLDTDTQLPRDAARQFVGTMAHPLNQPRFDDRLSRVRGGHGILQPRVSPSLPGTNRSRYARMHSGETGIDPYTRTVSDVYQDLFDEGSFIGKGIYDVDAFEQSLNGKFPENRILSHDLLEGCYARSGLLSDLELFEDYPATYAADAARRNRWVRGDWQIASWLLPWVPGAAGQWHRNRLSAVSLWKIADNLRRSLVPIATLVLLLVGWTLLPSARSWTFAVVGILMVSPLLGSLRQFLRKPREAAVRQHLAAAMRSSGAQWAQAGLMLACLPHEAFSNADAVLRTTWRMLVSHRRRLEWSPYGAQVGSGASGLMSSLRLMWLAPMLALAAAIYLTMTRPLVLVTAAPILLLWLAAPGVTWWLSRPLVRQEPRLTHQQQDFLHALARRTWAFFETFIGPEDNWLPPDNFQEQPGPAVAHRTSPTNMGLALLANLAAHDFGYLSTGRLLERTARALRSMASLERYRGHFYNWYDTQSLQPLLPMYVSTVDSGNLAAHLLTLRVGLLALPDEPILPRTAFQGLADTVGVAGESQVDDVAAPRTKLRRELDSAIASGVTTLGDARRRLDRLAELAGDLASTGNSASVAATASTGQQQDWPRALLDQCRDARDELVLLASWTSLAAPPAGLEGLSPHDEVPTLREVARLEHHVLPEIDRVLAADCDAETRAWLLVLRESIASSSELARQRIATIEELARQVSEFASPDFEFLYDASRRLLAIGYSVTERRRDASYYDLLASEARLGSFVAIAQGQLPQESWFALGRLLTRAGGDPVLVSWSGSMFEYLMPLLVMPTYPNTLLEQTNRAVVRRQMEYGRQRGVPWGMSESGYNMVDANRNYQYRAFGVPGLGLQRGLADDLVVAPYASALALMIEPEAACQNLQRLAADGLLGPFGMHEAVDYTPSRMPRGQLRGIVRSYMAHHQGMSLLSLADLLLDHRFQKRFASDPLFQAALMLLHERIPRTAAFLAHPAALAVVHAAAEPAALPMRVIGGPDTPVPEVQLLSNGRYHVLVTAAGGGYSRWKELAVTRWQEDPTRDHQGSFCYIRDTLSGAFWSNTWQPTRTQPAGYEAIFTEGRAEFHRQDRVEGSLIETRTEIVVSPEDDIELRRIRLINRSRERRTVEVTSYVEVALATPAADSLHPAFGKLFVQTEIVRAKRAVLCTRRPRARGEQPGWLFHQMAVTGADTGETSFETDRARFIGRGRTLASPRALDGLGQLSGSQGAVLDPVIAIRQVVILDPDQSVTIDLVTGAAATRDTAEKLIERYQDRHLADRVFDLAWTHNQVVLQQFGISEAEAQEYAHLAGSMIFADGLMRADASVILKNRRGQSGLWGYAISGDLPIVLLKISDLANISLVRRLLRARSYWRLKGLIVDLVIWTEDQSGYRQKLHDEIMGLISAVVEANVIDRPGGIFVRAADHISLEDRLLLQSVARVIIDDGRGGLTEQLKRRRPTDARIPVLLAVANRVSEAPAAITAPRADLILTNDVGGFTRDGREYVITLGPGRTTPAPWVNVISNEQFGTVVSENGVGYTWSENAHEFRLSPWHNDPVTDASGEAFYLRDEDTGRFWSPSPLPAPGQGTYVSRHGFGYSIFEHDNAGIHSEMTVFVALDAPVKFSVLKIRNDSAQARRLSATGYVEWVLGDLRAKTAMHVTTEFDTATGALFARNSYNSEFPDRIAFFDVDDANRTVTGDRVEFLGRNGSLQKPAAMLRTRLSGKVGAAVDPCAAIQVDFALAPGQEHQIVFRMGAGRGIHDVRAHVNRFRGVGAAVTAIESVWEYWKRTLGTVQVETPDESVNVLTNGWLVYQTLACRLWARSGYYQSGGAFGFRDQLQDVMALVHAEPQLVRAHLLLCASRQFEEGDVQHWWHPPAGRGVRTRCSDDYLWLPLATCRYVFATGDTGILEETAPFLEGRAVNPGDESYYDLPGRSDESASIYQHCVRAIRHGLRFGAHGLPLIGSGDWNDGMNLVGIHGKGESVWLAFFLCEVLRQFAQLARQRDDEAFAKECDDVDQRLRDSIERHGWDGSWYRRAYFDDGTPLGSEKNSECRIDSIAQSWSVLSGVADAGRAQQAMEALDQQLVRRSDRLVQLLDPPFDQSDLDPGYIRGYVPGVRENGGQYTHAAVWASMAFAALGDSRRAWELFTIINPANHALSREDAERYKVEPYVVTADVYASLSHVGRGGWSWYTGSAGWTYRLILESLLGLRLEVDKLRFEPCLPAHWPSFRIHYRYRDTHYHIMVTQGAATGATQSCATTVTLDGAVRPDAAVPLVDDRQAHSVEVNFVGGTRAP
jgi:cyclic beta-1,2-glucan synthetase